MDKIFTKSKILLPHNNIDMKYWPSLACDQFTSQPDYWDEAENYCKGQKSTLFITLPEVYLESENVDERINTICENMKEYKKNVLTKTIDGFVYTKRYFENKNEPLCGIVGTVDLEQYSYEENAMPAIRPSENTVVSRIPPRLKVRSNAQLETPHILMLIDDAENTVIEPIEQSISELECVYDTPLMLGGGSAKGYAVTNKSETNRIETAISLLGSTDVFNKKYPLAKGKTPLCMAVGDGNHSLATAKAHWEVIKKGITKEKAQNHPARYCLVELVNIHSPAIEIEPIHRVIFNTDINLFKSEFVTWLNDKGASYNVCTGTNSTNKSAQYAQLLSSNFCEDFCIDNSPYALCVGTVEAFIDYFCEKHKNSHMHVDYIHGKDVVKKLASQNCVGIILPEFEKGDIFKGVVLGGVLPRKTFSMGTAKEKRYYLECRNIV